MFYSNKLSSLLCFVVLLFLFLISIISIHIADFSTSTQSLSFDGKFVWPLPGYKYISSYFGPRHSPTAGASSNHSGIDIPAPEGTKILAVCNGVVSFCSWGAGRRIYYSSN